MSFFKMSDGTAPEATGNAEMGGGNLPPIPGGTQLKAMITEAKWAEANQYNDEHINLRWDVIDGEYKKRVVFHKVKVMDSDANKRDKAIRMLAAIDSNAGGKVMAINGKPSDMDLMQCLCNKPMVIKVEEWHMGEGDDKRSGNWVSAVSSGKAQAPAQNPPQQPGAQQGAQPTQTQNPDTQAADNEIGF